MSILFGSSATQEPLAKDLKNQPLLALALACKKGSLSKAKRALKTLNKRKRENGFHYNIDDKSFKKVTCFWIACDKGHLKIAKLLYKNGASIAKPGAFGTSPLTAAAHRGNLSLVKWLVKKGSKVNDNNHQWFTPIVAASFKGHLSIVKWLLKMGADKNDNSCRWFTPLIAACFHDNQRIVQFLLDINTDATTTTTTTTSTTTATPTKTTPEHKPPALNALLSVKTIIAGPSMLYIGCKI